MRYSSGALMMCILAALSGCGGGWDPALGTSKSGGASGTGGTGIVVTPASASVYQAQSIQFHAQVIGQSKQEVTWSLQDNFGTIDGTGLYTAPHDGYGTTVVVATSQAVPSAIGSVAVRVLPVQILVSPKSVTLAPGGMQQFATAVAGLSNPQVIWSLLDAGGGALSNSGYYIAPSNAGFYHVTATSVADTTRTGSATIAVTTSSSRFVPAQDMNVGRGFHTATLLPDGHVLVTGGIVGAADLCADGTPSAELYDPVAGVFAFTGMMTSPRYAHTATLLTNGRVLVAGGSGPAPIDCSDLGEPVLSSAELYDPTNGTFIATGQMGQARVGHTATLLLNGQVLIAGGGDTGGGDFPLYGTATTTAEIYDPLHSLFKPAGKMVVARFGHTASLLSNGKVLITGGAVTSLGQPTNTAEIYDPATDSFAATGSMSTSRSGHTATMLTDGTVLIAGGYTTFTNGTFVSTTSAEIYDPATGQFRATSNMGLPRFSHTATLLSTGLVLIAGGGDSTAELYDPVAGSFSPAAAMQTSPSGHTATWLQNQRVLVTGGEAFPPMATAEVYR